MVGCGKCDRIPLILLQTTVTCDREQELSNPPTHIDQPAISTVLLMLGAPDNSQEQENYIYINLLEKI